MHDGWRACSWWKGMLLMYGKMLGYFAKGQKHAYYKANIVGFFPVLKVY